MATLNILPNGSTSGNPSSTGNPKPTLRSTSTGWNKQVSSRLKKWFYSVYTPDLDGFGYAFTLTVRDCPESSDVWHNLRKAFAMRLERSGSVRMQWLTEWQERGVPHLHGIAYFNKRISNTIIIDHWIKLTSDRYGSASFAQDCKPIESIGGWLQYLTKHSSRSAIHYQRSPENIPLGWVKTGRMWGKYGSWPIREPMRFELCQDAFYCYRRIVRKLGVSSARDRLLTAKTNVRRNFELNPRLSEILLSGTHNSSIDTDLLSKHSSLISKYRVAKRDFSNHKKGSSYKDSDTSRFIGTSSWLDQDDSIKIVNHLSRVGFIVHQK